MLILLTSVGLIFSYSQASKMAKKSRRSFGFIFSFAIAWVCSLVLYFTDAYADYKFKVQIVFTSLPIFFTFLVVAIVLDNLIRIFKMLDTFNDNFWLKIPVFRVCAGFCILTQVLNPTLAWFEKANPLEIAQGRYEHNALFFTRNSLTTVAIVVLSGYIVYVGGLLNHEL